LVVKFCVQNITLKEVNVRMALRSQSLWSGSDIFTQRSTWKSLPLGCLRTCAA